MSQMGTAMDASTAREMILRDSELEVSFEGFCDIVKAAGERTRRKESQVGAAAAAAAAAAAPPQQQGRASLNAVVLEKYKNNHAES
jgi:hypothetical protein